MNTHVEELHSSETLTRSQSLGRIGRLKSGRLAVSERSPEPVPTEEPEHNRTSRDYDIVLSLPGRLLSQSLEWAITSHGCVQRVRSAVELDELLTIINAESPRVVLLDEHLAGPNLQTIARQIPVRLGDTAIAIFADRLSCRQLHFASHYVNGLLSRQGTIQSFMLELDTIAAGRKIASESLSSRVVLNSRKRFEVASVETIQNLTNRQLEVLVRIALGMSAKEAAADLHITEKAIESHKYRLMRILGVRDRIELCRWAIREGIIES